MSNFWSGRWSIGEHWMSVCDGEEGMVCDDIIFIAQCLKNGGIWKKDTGLYCLSVTSSLVIWMVDVHLETSESRQGK